MEIEFTSDGDINIIPEDSIDEFAVKKWKKGKHEIVLEDNVRNPNEILGFKHRENKL